MAKYQFTLVHNLNAKKMYLDTKVYYSTQQLGIPWPEIEEERNRLRMIDHPKPTYNTAAMFLIDKKTQAGIQTMLSPSTKKVPFFKTVKPKPYDIFGKKGQGIDNLALIVSGMIMLTLVVLFAAYMGSQNDTVQAGPGDAVYKATFNTSIGGQQSAMDKGLVVGLIILIGFLLYSAWTIGSNFSMFLLALLLNMAALFTLPIAEDYLVTAFYNNNYVAAIASMPATFYIINHYTIFITGIIVLLMLAFFLRPANG